MKSVEMRTNNDECADLCLIKAKRCRHENVFLFLLFHYFLSDSLKKAFFESSNRKVFGTKQLINLFSVTIESTNWDRNRDACKRMLWHAVILYMLLFYKILRFYYPFCEMCFVLFCQMVKHSQKIRSFSVFLFKNPSINEWKRQIFNHMWNRQ